MINDLIKIFGQQGAAGIIGASFGAIITGIIAIVIGLISYLQTKSQITLAAKYSFLQKALDILIENFNDRIILEAIDFDQNQLIEDINERIRNLNYEQLKHAYPLSVKDFAKSTSELYKNAFLLSNNKDLTKKQKEAKSAINNIQYNNNLESYKSAIIKKAVFETALQSSILDELNKISKKLK